MTDLEVVLRLVGFATALIGTCAAVPTATLDLWAGIRAWVESLPARLRRHRHVTLPAETATALAAMGVVSVKVTASGRVTGTTLEERLDYLETQISQLDETLGRLTGELRDAVADQRGRVEDLERWMTAEVERLDERADDQEKTQVRIDIRALPVVLAGLFLTTFPDWLAKSPMIGTIALGFGIGFFLRGAWLLQADAEARQSAPLKPAQADSGTWVSPGRP